MFSGLLFSCASASMTKCFPLLITKDHHLILLKNQLNRSGEGCSHRIISDIIDFSPDYKTISLLKSDTFIEDSCALLNPEAREYFNNRENFNLHSKSINNAVKFCLNYLKIKEWFNYKRTVMYQNGYAAETPLLSQQIIELLDSAAAYEYYGSYDSSRIIYNIIYGYLKNKDSVIFNLQRNLSYISEQEFADVMGITDVESIKTVFSIVEYETPSGTRFYQVHKLFSESAGNPVLHNASKNGSVPLITCTQNKLKLSYVHENFQWHHAGIDFIYLSK